MSKATDILDKLARSERKRSLRYFFVGTAMVVVILLAGFLGSVGKTKNVEGTTSNLYAKSFGLGEIMYLLVTLDDGRNVKVYLPSKAPFIKNARVVATETTTWLFGSKRYSFLYYAGKEERPTRQ